MKKKLAKLGVPRFDSYKCDYYDFHENNNELMNFLKMYGSFVILTLPRVKGLIKAYKVSVKTFEDCKRFLQEHVLTEHDKYDVSIVEHEYDNGSGCIISNGSKVLIDIGDCGLDELSYGYNPDASATYCDGKINYSTTDAEKIAIIDKALNHITKDGKPMKGYFEFLITRKNEIRFWDYKDKEAYYRI